MQININMQGGIKTDTSSWLDAYGVTKERADEMMNMLKSKLTPENNQLEFGKIHKGILEVTKELLLEPSPKLNEIVFFIAKSGYSVAKSAIDPLDQLLEDLKGAFGKS